MQNQIKIMDHQIQNDAHFSSAAVHPRTGRGVSCHAFGFDTADIAGDGVDVVSCLIEAFGMTNCEDYIVFLGGVDHVDCLFQRGGDRFFNQDMFAHFHKRNGSCSVVSRRHGNAQCIAFRSQFLPAGKNFQSEFSTDFGGGFR